MRPSRPAQTKPQLMFHQDLIAMSIAVVEPLKLLSAFAARMKANHLRRKIL